MFGYVTINRQELKVKDQETYQSYYCGLCRQLRKRWGLLESSSLNYDMTFLAILLSGLYEEEGECRDNKCMLHPIQRRELILTEAQAYAADMNFMLAYHNLMDDWLDEKKPSARVMASVYHNKYKKAAKQYPRQHKALVNYVRKLHACEKRGREDVEEAATLTGQAMAEIYAWKKDMWEEPLRLMGFYMGKFIYLMDAYEDVEKDEKSGSYNPLLSLYRSGELEQKTEEYLKLMMGGCCRAFEMLPILDNVDLLRNILYSGVWMKFAYVTGKRHKKAEGKKENGAV